MEFPKKISKVILPLNLKQNVPPPQSESPRDRELRSKIDQVRNEIKRTEREYQLFQKQAQDSIIEASTNEETKQAILRPFLERFGLILIDVHKNKDQTTTRAKIGKKAKPDATDTTQIKLF